LAIVSFLQSRIYHDLAAGRNGHFGLRQGVLESWATITSILKRHSVTNERSNG